ncbi:MAG: CatB-related O-acetyltransferase [Pseudomonadota bacterium]
MADGPPRDDRTAALDHLAALNIHFRPSLTGPIPESGVAFERRVRLHPDRLMPLGAYSYSNSVLVPCRRIGRYCSIAANVRIMGAAHPVDWASTSPVFYRGRPNKLMGGPGRDLPEFKFRPQPMRIGNDVWIGQDVILSAGVEIGDGAVVAAGSVVTKSVAPYAIVGGAPAQVIRMRFADDVIMQMQAMRWWRFGLTALEGLDPTSPMAFLDGLETRIAHNRAAELPEDRRTMAAWLATDAAP